MKVYNAGSSLDVVTHFSEAEQEIILLRLWELLKVQVEKYNGIDSTSMPIEKAQDILESLLYTIGVASPNGITKEELLNDNLSSLLEQGRRVLKEKKKAVKVEWKLMCQELPQIRNVYYLSTIKELGTFFEKYNIYSEAHNIPCSIDYWPLCPISENLRGISFIEKYIRRLQIENDFLNNFQSNDICSLYENYIPDYADALFNLCEPVLTNAIGLGIIGQDFHKLNISTTQRNSIFQMLVNKTVDEIQIMIEDSVLFICREIEMTLENEQDYLITSTKVLTSRVFEAIKHQDISNIFISFDSNTNVND